MNRLLVILSVASLLNCSFQGAFGGCLAADRQTEPVCTTTCSPDGCRPSGCELPTDENDRKSGLPTDDRCCSTICQCIFLVPDFQFEIGQPGEIPNPAGPIAGKDFFEQSVWFSIWPSAIRHGTLRSGRRSNWTMPSRVAWITCTNPRRSPVHSPMAENRRRTIISWD